LDKKKKTIFYLVFLVLFMASASFLSVPFYNWFCKVTGYGGATNVAQKESDIISDKIISVRFDASLEKGLEWEVKPVQRNMTLNLGETGLAFYEAYNPTDKPIAAQASFNVVPFSVGNFFNKIECFCFTEQILQPGEKIKMPVSFYVDPDLINNLESKNVTSVTLSYTFYEIDLPETASYLENNKDFETINLKL
jgi:cytochrome c oxidase assembly protein subunit 11|tara:strand:+ start:5565 stop:6146 length:582 start_codon:yes stop_codon:yes gene_type:complete